MTCRISSSVRVVFLIGAGLLRPFSQLLLDLPHSSFSVAARATILDGAEMSKAWQGELKKEAAAVTHKLGRPPGLAVVIVGDRPDSSLYVQRKQEAAARV